MSDWRGSSSIKGGAKHVGLGPHSNLVADQRNTGEAVVIDARAQA